MILNYTLNTCISDSAYFDCLRNGSWYVHPTTGKEYSNYLGCRNFQNVLTVSINGHVLRSIIVSENYQRCFWYLAMDFCWDNLFDIMAFFFYRYYMYYNVILLQVQLNTKLYSTCWLFSFFKHTCIYTIIFFIILIENILIKLFHN